jgi:hypothetical protein
VETSLDISVIIEMDYGLDGRGSVPGSGSQRPDGIRVPPSLLSYGHWGLFSWAKVAGV